MKCQVVVGVVAWRCSSPTPPQPPNHTPQPTTTPQTHLLQQLGARQQVLCAHVQVGQQQRKGAVGGGKQRGAQGAVGQGGAQARSLIRGLEGGGGGEAG